MRGLKILKGGTRGRCKLLIALAISLGGSPAIGAPYPTNPYNTVGGALPTGYCRNPVDSAGPYQSIDLESVGCYSGTGPAGYANGANGLYTDTDGLYGSSGGGDSEGRVEQAIMMATGEVVDLMLYRESGSGNSSGSGIQVWIENSGKQFTWAFEQSLIAQIQAGSVDIAYLTIKAANSYAVYEIPTGVYAGRYSTEGLLTNGSQQPAVSHIRFWKEVDYSLVPEPGVIALFGFGALALGMRRRRP